MKSQGRKQKFFGVALVLISIMSAIATDGDITFLMVFLPLGIYITATEENFVTEEGTEIAEAERTGSKLMKSERKILKVRMHKTENKSCISWTKIGGNYHGN